MHIAHTHANMLNECEAKDWFIMNYLFSLTSRILTMLLIVYSHAISEYTMINTKINILLDTYCALFFKNLEKPHNVWIKLLFYYVR